MAGSLRFYLDVVLFIFISTLFKRHIISADYHVWGGLVFFGLILWHVWLNRKWLTGFIQRQKHWQDWVNLLFLLVWLAMIITGMLVAKQFGLELHFLKPWHKFLGALSLLLVAMHIGFHWQYLKENILRRCPCLKKVPQVITTILLVGTLCLGGYGYVDSGFGKWLSAPFTAAPQRQPAGAGGSRKKHQPQPFNPEKVAKHMAEMAAMLYLGAYLVRKRK